MKDRVEHRLDDALTTVCATRFRHSGYTQLSRAALAFGIFYLLSPAAGSYDPDDIRFHSLYRFLDRFCSNITIVFIVDAGSTPVGLDLLVRFPYCAFRQ